MTVDPSTSKRRKQEKNEIQSCGSMSQNRTLNPFQNLVRVLYKGSVSDPEREVLFSVASIPSGREGHGRNIFLKMRLAMGRGEVRWAPSL